MKNRHSRRGGHRSALGLREMSSSQFLSPRREDRAAQKTAQLCRQVERVLALILPACADELVQDLMPVSVRPAPDATRLLIEVRPTFTQSSLTAADLAERLSHLEAALPYLRHEVAASITRKRAPELMFMIVQAHAEFS